MLTKNGKPTVAKRVQKKRDWLNYRYLPMIPVSTAMRYQRRFGGSVVPEGIMQTVIIINRDAKDTEYPVARVQVPTMDRYYQEVV